MPNRDKRGMIEGMILKELYFFVKSYLRREAG
jgi:hypothetical protein